VPGARGAAGGAGRRPVAAGGHRPPALHPDKVFDLFATGP
jgi:hypothetical protein